MRTFKILFFVLFFSGFLSAQRSSSPDSIKQRHNGIYLNMGDLVFSTYSLVYERDIKRNSLMIQGGWTYWKNSDKLREGGAGEIQYRFNMVGEKAGYDRFAFFYFAPYAQFRYIYAEEQKDGFSNSYPAYASFTYFSISNLRSYNGGALIGLNLYSLKTRFCGGFYAGGGFRYADVKGSDQLFETEIYGLGFTGVIPRIGFQAGIRF